MRAKEFLTRQARCNQPCAHCVRISCVCVCVSASRAKQRETGHDKKNAMTWKPYSMVILSVLAASRASRTRSTRSALNDFDSLLGIFSEKEKKMRVDGVNGEND